MPYKNIKITSSVEFFVSYIIRLLENIYYNCRIIDTHQHKQIVELFIKSGNGSDKYKF